MSQTQCTSCGAQLPPDARFCGVCGQPANAAPAQAAPVVQPQAPWQPPVQQPPQAQAPWQQAPQAAPPQAPVPVTQQPASQAAVQPRPAGAPTPQAQPLQPLPSQASPDTWLSPGADEAPPATSPRRTPQVVEVVAEVPRSANGRFLEVGRRLVAAWLLMAGVALITFEPERLWVAEVVDWGADYARDSTREPVAQFAGDKLSTPHVVTDPGWRSVHDEVLLEPADTEGRRRKVLAHDHPLVSKQHGYVVLQQGTERRTLRVSEAQSWDLEKMSVPLLVSHPYLPYGAPVPLLALLFYVLVRWKTRDTPVRYKTWITTLLDVLGLALAGAGGLALGAAATDPIGTVVSLAIVFTLVCQVVFLPTAYFAAKRAVLLPDRLRVLTLFGQTDFPYSRIAGGYMTLESQSPVLAIVLIVLGITNGVSVLLGVVMLLRKDWRLTVRRDDGKTFKLWAKSVEGIDELQMQLASHGVPTDRVG